MNWLIMFTIGAVDLEASEIQLQIGDSKEVKHLTPKKVWLQFIGDHYLATLGCSEIGLNVGRIVLRF